MKVDNKYWDKKLNELSKCDCKRDYSYWDMETIKVLKQLALEMYALGASEQFERDYKGMGWSGDINPSWKDDKIEILPDPEKEE